MLSHLLVLVAVWLAFVVSPGPNFVTVIHQSTARSRRNGFATVAGIATGTVIWVVGAMAGLAVLFARFGWLAGAVKMVGGAYLMWLGVRTVRAAGRASTLDVPAPTPSDLPRRGSAYLTGLLTDLANPKAAVFFSSMFAVLLPAGPPLWLRAATLVLVVCVEAAWYATVVGLVTLAPVLRAYRRAKRVLDLVTGGLLVALGVRLAAAG
jgi:RhtB (resistance to homoserine/threonine) family protein